MIFFLDAGHGTDNSGDGTGFDPGAVFGTYTEATIALSVVSTVGYYAKLAGHTVIYSRLTNNTPAPLKMRVQRAKAAKADILLSVHCNSFTNRTANGTETFYRPEKTGTNGAFAGIVQNAALTGFGLRDRGVKTPDKSPRKSLAILSGSMPSALLEIGFITSPGDLVAMLERKNRIVFATALLESLGA